MFSPDDLSRHDRIAPRVRSIRAIESQQSDSAARRMRRSRRAAPPGADFDAAIVTAISSSKLANRLESIVGAVTFAHRSVLKRAPPILIAEPASVEEIASSSACAKPTGSRSRPLARRARSRRFSRAPVAIGISLARMARIVAYEPARHDGRRGGRNHRRRTERRDGRRPPAPSRRSVAIPRSTTLGALVAAAHAGPLRLSEGTVARSADRNSLCRSRRQFVHGGGRVVKNVAGYDLMKLMSGSFGTLGIITEATFKVRPIPESYTSRVSLPSSTRTRRLPPPEYSMTHCR